MLMLYSNDKKKILKIKTAFIRHPKEIMGNVTL